MSLPFSFTQPPPSLPIPPVGYILQVTNAGALQVQCAGTFGNIIPPGPQILMPTDITYIVKSKIKLGKNTIIQPGFTNTTQSRAQLRDNHTNDAFDNVLAWTWSDNSNNPDKSDSVLNVYVAIGKVSHDGTLKVKAPIQLSNFAVNYHTFNSAVAINRSDKNNIIVTWYAYNIIDATVPNLYQAISFDGGKTWPINTALTNIPNFNNIGESTGVRSDKYGNIWLNYGAPFATDNPTFLVSSNKGIDYQLVYTAPLPSFFQPTDYGYDYPQYCFGGDGQGNYGLWFVSDYINTVGDLVQFTGFIPINGKGISNIGTGTITELTNLINANSLSNITASLDGRVWLQGIPNTTSAETYIAPGNITYKSPGPLDQNYAGPWNYAFANQINIQYGISTEESQPILGYIPLGSVNSLIYDDQRQALYAMYQAQFPDYSQNMRLYFVISRDNGQTWSQPIDIESDFKNNRGFETMALDTKTGNLIFGWYDARNSPDGLSVQYFGAVITAKELDCLVNQIPLSNPLYSIPSATVGSVKVKSTAELTETQKMILAKRKEIRRKRFGIKS